jgi:hypothetical protein
MTTAEVLSDTIALLDSAYFESAKDPALAELTAKIATAIMLTDRTQAHAQLKGCPDGLCVLHAASGKHSADAVKLNSGRR